MGRPKKIKEVTPDISNAAETVAAPVVEEKKTVEEVKPIINNKKEIVLVKTLNRYIVSQLIILDKNVSVKHISGSGLSTDPKNWYVEASIGTLDKLSKEEQDEIIPASYKEIDERIQKSFDKKRQEQKENGAQKRKPGEPPVASAHY